MDKTPTTPQLTRRLFLAGIGAALLNTTLGSGCSMANAIGRSLSRTRFRGQLPTRGVTLDRQYLRLPSVPNFDMIDIQLIKSMGFEHVKLVVNPEPHKSGAGIEPASMWYVDEIVNLVVNEGLPVVVCIHPEMPFKRKVLGDHAEFEQMLGFYEEFAGYLAKRWGPEELVFQLMTEPADNQWDWNETQKKMWEAARQGMPEHTLVLSGNQYAFIEALVNVEPVQDDKVIYAFHFYQPFLFTFQGGSWASGYIPYLQHVPYPSSPEIIEAALEDILAKVPERWRAQAKADLRAYGDERWNRDKLAARVQMAVDWAKDHGAPKMWVSEWGVYQGKVHPEQRYAFIRDARELFEQNGIGWTHWSFNETFSVLTPEGRVDHQMLPALGLEA